jgi:rhamnose transport system substrate-binding protein
MQFTPLVERRKYGLRPEIKEGGMKKPLLLVLVMLMAIATIVPAAERTGGDDEITIALVVKNIGNPFFDAIKRGWDEAVAELDVVSVYRGPELPTAEGQIEIMEQLIAQRVDSITYAANDPQALVPVSQKAMDAGIKVVGWESGIVPDSRNISVLPASARSIGFDQVKIINNLIGGEGEIAILSAASTMANQNTWIAYMLEALETVSDYANLDLVATVYGDDLREKSYNEALGLFRSYPDLKGIISPTTVGVAAAARAVTDEGLIDKIEVTGLGLPSEMAEYVNNGASKVFGLWNPIDLGYLNAYVAYHLASGNITGVAGDTFEAGRLGSYEVVPEEGVSNGLVYLGGVYEFNADNIDDFKEVF